MRGLLVLIACGLQHFLMALPTGHAVDLETLADLADIFSFSEVRKRTLQSRLCSAMCDTASDHDIFLNCGGIIIYVTFNPNMDDTLRTSLPREVRIALRSHKTLFYSGGLVLNVVSSIPFTPAALF